MFYVCKLKFSGAFTVKVGTVVIIVVVVVEVEVGFLYFVVEFMNRFFWKVGFMESNWQSNYSYGRFYSNSYRSHFRTYFFKGKSDQSMRKSD